MVQASTGRPERPCNGICAVHSHFYPSLRKTELPCAGAEPENSDGIRGHENWVRLLPRAVLTVNSQESPSTGYSLHELIHGGRAACFFKAPFPEDYKSPVGDWLEHRQDLANLGRAKLKHVPDRNRTRRPASFKVGDLMLVHHSRLPTWPRNCLQDPFFWPYHIIKIDGSSPRLGGELLSAPKQLRHCHSPDELTWDEWRLSDWEVERIVLENAANREEADELKEMTADGSRPLLRGCGYCTPRG